MKTLKDFIESFKYNKYNDYLLNYSYEDFCEDKIVETLFGEDDKIHSYLDYQFIKYLQGDEYDMYSKYQQLLYESLLKSYNTKKFVNVLSKKFKEYIFKIELIKTSDIVNSIRIKFNKEFDTSNSEYQSLLNLYNYYESKNIDNKIITLSPRISEDMSDKVYNESNGIVYHICPNYVVNKILENGLRPKGGKNSKIYKNRVWHPKSIYVIFNKVDNDTKKYFKQEIENDKITNEYDNNVLSDNDVTILKIDLNKYDRKLKFYKDTLGGKSFVYTREYIPPQCITVYKENKIKNFLRKIFK